MALKAFSVKIFANSATTLYIDANTCLSLEYKKLISIIFRRFKIISFERHRLLKVHTWDGWFVQFKNIHIWVVHQKSVV